MVTSFGFDSFELIRCWGGTVFPSTGLSEAPLDCVGQSSSEGSFLAAPTSSSAPGLVVEKVPGSLRAPGEGAVRKAQ